MKRIITASGILIVLSVLAGASCPSVIPQPSPTPSPGIADVVMQNIAFVPQNVSIRRGDTVRWSNLDNLYTHTVTSGNPGDADAGSLFDSGPLSTNQIFTHQFNDVGEFVYFCRMHPTVMLNARVIVAE